MKDKPDMKLCNKCGVKTYPYKVNKAQPWTLYFHPGTCKKKGY